MGSKPPHCCPQSSVKTRACPAQVAWWAGTGKTQPECWKPSVLVLVRLPDRGTARGKHLPWRCVPFRSGKSHALSPRFSGRVRIPSCSLLYTPSSQPSSCLTDTAFQNAHRVSKRTAVRIPDLSFWNMLLDYDIYRKKAQILRSLHKRHIPIPSPSIHKPPSTSTWKSPGAPFPVIPSTRQGWPDF